MCGCTCVRAHVCVHVCVLREPTHTQGPCVLCPGRATPTRRTGPALPGRRSTLVLAGPGTLLTPEGQGGGHQAMTSQSLVPRMEGFMQEGPPLRAFSSRLPDPSEQVGTEQQPHISAWPSFLAWPVYPYCKWGADSSSGSPGLVLVAVPPQAYNCTVEGSSLPPARPAHGSACPRSVHLGRQTLETPPFQAPPPAQTRGAAPSWEPASEPAGPLLPPALRNLP